MNADEAERLSELLKIHKKRLNILEEQSAKYGFNCPPEIRMEIEELREKVDRFERQVKGNIIETFVQGKNVLRQFNLDLDAIQHGLSNVVIKEERVFRFLGIPLWSSVVVRTISMLVIIASIAGMLYIITDNDRLKTLIQWLFPNQIPTVVPTEVISVVPTVPLQLTILPSVMPASTSILVNEPTATSTSAPTPLPQIIVRGVKSQYDYTNRIAQDAGGSFTRMRVEPNVGSNRVGLLRNDDQVAILRTDVDGWYQVRITTSSDLAQIGTQGWIERWLIEDANVPPSPTPSPMPRRSPTGQPTATQEPPTATPEPAIATLEPPTATLESLTPIPAATATHTPRPKPPATSIPATPIPPTATNTPILVIPTPKKPTPTPEATATNTPRPALVPSSTPTSGALPGRE